ncbi:MAG: hypothetical protein GF353_24940 [Candidatus Lokiarchaeota archaeon]|nr:hypothetical protein [Candidatus Lokiarchaeota archaeon]
MNYSKFCQRCQHYRYDLYKGIVCGLTNGKPDFEEECENFELDPSKGSNTTEANFKKEVKKNGFGKEKRMLIFLLIVIPIWILSTQIVVKTPSLTITGPDYNSGIMRHLGFVDLGKDASPRFQVFDFNSGTILAKAVRVDYGDEVVGATKNRFFYRTKGNKGGLVMDLLKDPFHRRGKLTGLQFFYMNLFKLNYKTAYMLDFTTPSLISIVFIFISLMYLYYLRNSYFIRNR